MSNPRIAPSRNHADLAASLFSGANELEFVLEITQKYKLLYNTREIHACIVVIHTRTLSIVTLNILLV